MREKGNNFSGTAVATHGEAIKGLDRTMQGFMYGPGHLDSASIWTVLFEVSRL